MNIKGSLAFVIKMLALAAVSTLAFIPRAHAQNCFTVTPLNLQANFQSVAVGTRSALQQDIIVINNCTTNLTLQSFSITPGEFHLTEGWQPSVISPNHKMTYSIIFVPDSAQTFNGSFTINIAGYNPVVVSLSGTGFITGAVANLTPAALTFANQPIGSSSPTQTVTYKNTGTVGFQVQSIYADPPFYVTGFTKAFSLYPGHSFPVQVAFIPTAPGTYTGALVMTSNVLPPHAVTLSGTAIGTSVLSVANFPALPSGTSGFAYQLALLAAGGTSPYSWTLATGSQLPSGLSLSNSGLITGSIASTVGVGNYQFTAQVMDSSTPPNTATSLLTMSVATPNGASCNNIVFDVLGTNTPILPLDDLGSGYYEGVQGGLYLNGSNMMPASHDADGVSFAQAIQPLDANGNPDPNGKMGLISIGISNAENTFHQFIQDASGDPSVNPQLVLVPGAQPELGAKHYANINDPAWGAVLDFFLPQTGLTANQVVTAWVEAVDGGPSGTFPGDINGLESEYISIAQNMHTYFPNLKLLYFNSRYYAGYSNGTGRGPDPETYAYEDGYAVRDVIQDQINGNPALNYNPANGAVMAPWLAWGPYDWANGMLGRSDGLVWTCNQFTSDGTHMVPAGLEPDANMLLNFFKSTDTTMPWFLAPTQRPTHKLPARINKTRR